MVAFFVWFKTALGNVWLVVTALWILTNVAALVVPALQGNIAYRTIRLQLPQTLRKTELAFGLRHVRDGKDDIDNRGDIVDKDIPFRAIDSSARLEATVAFAKTSGFQFKCFVDVIRAKNGDFSQDDPEALTKKLQQVTKSLLEAGFDKVSIDERYRDRLWFLLKTEAKTPTKDGYENNFATPPSDVRDD